MHIEEIFSFFERYTTTFGEFIICILMLMVLHTIPHGPKNQCKVSFIMTSAIFCRLNDAISHQQQHFIRESYLYAYRYV